MRIQLGQGSAGEVTMKMLKKDGFGAFYKVWSFILNFPVHFVQFGLSLIIIYMCVNCDDQVRSFLT